MKGIGCFCFYKHHTRYNMKQGMLSIIIPYYCGEKYIKNTIDSILNSKYTNYEILIVDDGSPGNKGLLCDILSNYDNRIKVFHKSNGGIASARNYGVKVADGEFIAFVDQDDFVPDDMYSSLISMLLLNECDMVVSNFRCNEELTGKITDKQIIDYEGPIVGEELCNLRKWLVMGEVLNKPKVCIPSVVWNCVFRASIINDNKVEFESFIQYDDDWVFLLKYLEVSKKIYLTKNVYYQWYIHNDSESHCPKYLDRIDCRYENLRRFQKNYMLGCNVSYKERELFENYFYANFLYVATTNEAIQVRSIKSLAKAVNYIYQQVKSDRFVPAVWYDKKDVTRMLIKKKGKKAGIIFSLIMNKMCLAAVLLCKLVLEYKEYKSK